MGCNLIVRAGKALTEREVGVTEDAVSTGLTRTLLNPAGVLRLALLAWKRP
jgi:hypothetical protein